MAIGRCSEGEKPPLVILPTSLPSPSSTSAPSRTGWRPSTSKPTRFCGGAVLELGEDPHRAGEAAFGAAALVDREGQAGHHRRRLAVEVVAVERQPGFEPQRIARAEADRLDQLVGDDRSRPAAAAAIAGTEISNPSSPV